MTRGPMLPGDGPDEHVRVLLAVRDDDRRVELGDRLVGDRSGGDRPGSPVRVIAAVAETADALLLLDRLRPDVVLLDLEDEPATAEIGYLLAERPSTAVVVTAAKPSPRLARAARGRGALAVLCRTAPAERLVTELLRAARRAARSRRAGQRVS